MLLYAAPQVDILSLPEHPAEIVSISTDEKMIRYSIDVYINTSQVVAANAYTLVAQVLKKEPTTSFAKKSVKSVRSWNRKGKFAEKSVIAEALAEKKNNTILERKVDLTKYISNDLTNAPSQSPSLRTPNLTRAQQNSISALSPTFTVANPFSQASAITAPTTPGIVSPTTPTKKTVRSSAISSTMLSMKSDPALLTTKTFNALAGSSKSFTASAASFVMTQPVSVATAQAVRITPTRQKITFSLVVKKSALSSVASFCLNLELENAIGLKVDTTKAQIPHARIYNSFITPRLPPHLEAEYNKPGVVSVRVTPNKADKMAKSLRVFRRLTAPAEGGTDEGTPWVEVLRSSIDDFSEMIFLDEIATSRTIVYRAVSYGENFKPSESFSSTVVLPLKQFKPKQTGSLTAVASLAFEGSNTFTKVKVKDIPPDVVGVMVRRYNITNASDADRKASKGKGFEYVGTTAADQVKSADGLGANDTIVFSDLSTKKGRKYSFVPVGITRTGKEIVGSSALLEVPVSPERQQVQMSVSGPTIENASEVHYSLKFDLSARFTDFGFSEVRRALTSGGQRSLFDQDLLKDRSRFEKLIGFLVERKNSRTGEEESFGVVQSGEFKDDLLTRTSLNIKSPEPGVEYTYKFTALINSPETLFPDLASPEVDPKTLLSYSRKTAKFMNPQALTLATLMSNKRQRDPSSSSGMGPSDPLLAGRTNVEKSIEYRVPVSNVSSKKVTLERFKKFNRLVWRMSEVSKVDHFKIYVVSGGGRALIDTVHCDDSSSEFYYRHYDSKYTVNYQYVVVPINLSYEDMDALKSSVISLSLKKAFGLTSLDKLVAL